MMVTLTPTEARILGCLIEKSITTPEYYPLTLNSLTSACNQKSNRDPVMNLDTATVSAALEKLRYMHHLIWHVTVTGSRVPKYKHDFIDVIGVTDDQLAVLCVLMLRGPQTPGELRSRTGRLHAFESLADVIATLESLCHREHGALVTKLPREHGSREQRYQHLLCGDVDQAASPRDETAAAPEPPTAESASRA